MYIWFCKFVLFCPHIIHKLALLSRPPSTTLHRSHHILSTDNFEFRILLCYLLPRIIYGP